MAIRTPAKLQSPLTLNTKLQPKEIQLLDLMESNDCSLIGFGGAKGGAKSHAARSCAIIRRLKYPGTRALIFRRNYDDLWQQHIQMIAEEWPELYQRYWSAENKALMLPGRSMVLFRYADSFKDIMKFRGKEYGDVFIDEAAELEETELKILYSSCRTTVQNFQPKKVLTFNPGGPGHGYMKRLFIDKHPSAEEAVQNPQFIQAYAWDNVMWVMKALAEDGLKVSDYRAWPVKRQIDYLVKRSDYGKELNALPESLRKPWLYGDWDTFAGQAFSEFRRDIHVIDPPFDVPNWWQVWGSNDPGYNDAGTWYVHAAGPDGQIYTIREWSFADRTQIYSEQARRVKASLEEDGIKVCVWVTGMDAFNPNPETGKSIVDAYQAGGLSGFMEPDHGQGSRKRMAACVHEYLRPYPDPTIIRKPADLRDSLAAYQAEGKMIAKWRILSTCKKLIATLPTLPADENKPEQVADCDSDHWYQGAGYGLQYWHANRSTEPVKETFKSGTAGQIMNHARKLGLEPKKKSFFT